MKPSAVAVGIGVALYVLTVVLWFTTPPGGMSAYTGLAASVAVLIGFVLARREREREDRTD